LAPLAKRVGLHDDPGTGEEWAAHAWLAYAALNHNAGVSDRLCPRIPV